MPDQDDAPPAPPPTGQLFCTWGPCDGPVLRRQQPPALGVVAAPDRPMPIGIAFGVAQVEHHKGPAATFRRVIGGTELEGHWLCIGREFVRLGEAAEDL